MDRKIDGYIEDRKLALSGRINLRPLYAALLLNLVLAYLSYALYDRLAKTRVKVHFSPASTWKVHSDSSLTSFPLKAWMGATHFLTRRLPKVATEMSLHVLAYNLKRVMKIVGVGPLMQAVMA